MEYNEEDNEQITGNKKPWMFSILFWEAMISGMNIETRISKFETISKIK